MIASSPGSSATMVRYPITASAPEQTVTFSKSTPCLSASACPSRQDPPSGYRFNSSEARAIASRAAGNGPKGPSLDASLTTRSSPCSRCTSSTGLPGSYGTSPATARRITDGSMSPCRRLTLPEEAPRQPARRRARCSRRRSSPRDRPRRRDDGEREPPSVRRGCLPRRARDRRRERSSTVLRRRCLRRRSSTLSTVYPNTAFLLLMTLMETG